MLTKFILYCCPTGPLSVQIEAYFAQAKARFGANPAHNPARTQIDSTAAVAWELRFYEQGIDQSWCCHAHWLL